MRDGSLTKKRIERCALELFVQKGIDGTTIRDIAGAAKIAEGALYRHFKSKDELAQSLFVNSYAEFVTQAQAVVRPQETLEKKLTGMVEYFCKRFDEDPILFHYLLLSQYNQVAFLSQTDINAHKVLLNLFEQAIQQSLLPKKDPALYVNVVLGIVLQSAMSRVYKRIHRPMMDDCKFLVQAILNALNLAPPKKSK